MNEICLKHLTFNCIECYPVVQPNSRADTASSATTTISTTCEVSASGSDVPASVSASRLTSCSSAKPSGISIKPMARNAVENIVSVGQKRKVKNVADDAQKRFKKKIIDDEVACEIFRNLGLSNKFLNSGKVLAWALQPDDPAFIDIHDYVERSQGTWHGVKILSILRVLPNATNLSEGDAPLEHQIDFNEDPKAAGKLRMMLWHGTKKCNISSILENGLRIPTGMEGRTDAGWFGNGIYFADRVDNSKWYCDDFGKVRKTGYLFLCDVLLGDIYKTTRLMPGQSSAPKDFGWPFGTGKQYDSVQGCGRLIPDSEWNKNIDGCIWPLGHTVIDNTIWLPMLYYNEYIVYKTSQVQPKFLVKVKIMAKPVYEKNC